MTEEQERKAVVDEALTWTGTPYHANADVKGAGVDCGMILVRVFVDLGLRFKNQGLETLGRFPLPFDPRPYPSQWHLHNRGEKYKEIVEQLAKEFEGPPRPGDIVLFHYGLCYAHGAIVINWPIVIHAMGPSKVQMQDIGANTMLRNLRKKFFSIWETPLAPL